MGQVFYDMGFLSSPEVVECSASDLVGQYVGHTGPIVQKKFEQALGRVLFIDEAYRLAEGHFAKEAIDELVGILTQEKFKSKLVVILAGYDDDMNRLLAVNSGLSSRFPETITFRNMGPAHCLEVLKKALGDEDVFIEDLQNPSSENYTEMAHILDQLSIIPGWGNMRDVMTLSTKMINVAYSANVSSNFPAERAISVMREMLTERQSRSPTQLSPPMQTPMLQPASAPPLSTSAPSFSSSSKTKTSKKTVPIENVQEPANDGRDPGVSDSIWQQLRLDKMAAEKAARENAQRIADLERQVREAKELEAKQKALEEQMKRKAKNEAELLAFKRQQEEMRLRGLKALAERQKIEEALEARRKEEMKEARAQQKLRNLGVCPVGFHWIKQSGGYRCAGGSHWVNDAALE